MSVHVQLPWLSQSQDIKYALLQLHTNSAICKVPWLPPYAISAGLLRRFHMPKGGARRLWRPQPPARRRKASLRRRLPEPRARQATSARHWAMRNEYLYAYDWRQPAMCRNGYVAISGFNMLDSAIWGRIMRKASWSAPPPVTLFILLCEHAHIRQIWRKQQQKRRIKRGNRNGR